MPRASSPRKVQRALSATQRASLSNLNLSIKVYGFRWVVLYTVIFFVLKITHIVDWSWIFVWLPAIVWVGYCVFCVIVLFVAAMKITFTKE
jgi:hypothetical protein